METPPVASSLTMQDVLLRLQSFWTERGCLIVQPFNTEVGAGTANPATLLRVLGPEPWHVAYVEPSVRPDDSRYGENPNRLQTHTQFQVILKPDPGNPQELYLASLEALGIDTRAHDVRFVEDNWASPALGAWGLGWEVWLDGLEISQFTYFQQVGGLTVDPVSVEITYGIERIVMALQMVNHFKDIAYAPGISYGEVFGQIEYEMSRYYLDDAEIELSRRLFDNYAYESQRMIDLRLPVPAYSFLLKCSHTFNVLDARGAVSTTERATAFRQMRALVLQVAELWAARREDLGHPLGLVTPPPAAVLPGEFPEAAESSTLAFEIGVEELPHSEVIRGADAVRDAIIAKLASTRITHGEVRAFATPRRIAVVVDAVSPRESDTEHIRRGPRVTAAFDAEGAPTKAAAGFARANGVDVADLGRFAFEGVEYVGFSTTDVGRNSVVVLSELLGEIVAELRAEQNMRWRDDGLSFARPVRWIVALLDEICIPVVVSSLASGRTTRVHRTAVAPLVEIASADGYLDVLARHGIVLEAAKRRELIVAAAAELASVVGGTVDIDAEAELIDEVTNLVEEPHVILGSFDPRYLELPTPVLTTVMRKHQRYLPVRDKQGSLLPHFVAVANGACDDDVVRAGFEAVLRARYEDADFFWRADLESTPEGHRAGLTKLSFAERLGSVADRADRIASVSSRLASEVTLSNDEVATLARASELAKFDLASSMVIELSSLAGTMAREYALRSGEQPEVADALAEMELPSGGRGRLPESRVGAILALADRVDLLVGLFAVGARLTGSSDPFGLRRAAGGVVRILRAFPELSTITITKGLTAAEGALRARGVDVTDAAMTDAKQLVLRRYEQQLLDSGVAHNIVQAVLMLADAPALADRTLEELSQRVGTEPFDELATALQRPRRIVPLGHSRGYDPTLLREPAEVELVFAVQGLQQALDDDHLDFGGFVDRAVILTGPINAFFDEVLVMAEDPKLREARLGLLATINELVGAYLDWSAL